jgi:DNA-directed RNA polymerase specialized sigma24 family protein
LWRRRKARPVIVGGELPESPAEPTGETGDPVGSLITQEELRALRECIDGLGERSRKMVTLYKTGFSLSAMRGMLGECRSTVQGWRKQALEQLRRCMAGKGFAEVG